MCKLGQVRTFTHSLFERFEPHHLEVVGNVGEELAEILMEFLIV